MQKTLSAILFLLQEKLKGILPQAVLVFVLILTYTQVIQFRLIMIQWLEN